MEDMRLAAEKGVNFAQIKCDIPTYTKPLPTVAFQLAKYQQ
jgi:L-asparaginase II